jgi:hypothetical protein
MGAIIGAEGFYCKNFLHGFDFYLMRLRRTRLAQYQRCSEGELVKKIRAVAQSTARKSDQFLEVCFKTSVSVRTASRAVHQPCCNRAEVGLILQVAVRIGEIHVVEVVEDIPIPTELQSVSVRLLDAPRIKIHFRFAS